MRPRAGSAVRWPWTWLCCGAVLAALVLAGPLDGLTQEPVAGDRRFEFDLPAQPLGDALRRIAETTGLEIRYTPDIVAGRQAPSISGAMTADEALRRLLAGTDLTHRVVGAATIAILTRTEAARESGLELEPVTVLGTRRIGVPLATVPASITIVDRSEIQEELATTGRIEDAIKRHVPHFNPSNEGVRKIRGRTAQVFINGVPTNEQLRASSGNDLNLIVSEQTGADRGQPRCERGGAGADGWRRGDASGQCG
jgi:hypothetical protein